MELLFPSPSSLFELKFSEDAPPASEMTPAPMPRSSLNNERGNQGIKRRLRNVSVVGFEAMRYNQADKAPGCTIVPLSNALYALTNTSCARSYPCSRLPIRWLMKLVIGP